MEVFQVTMAITVAKCIPAVDDSALVLIQEPPVVYSCPVPILPNGNAQIKIDRCSDCAYIGYPAGPRGVGSSSTWLLARLHSAEREPDG